MYCNEGFRGHCDGENGENVELPSPFRGRSTFADLEVSDVFIFLYACIML